MLALLMLAAVLLSSVIDQLVPKVSSPLIQIVLGLGIALLAQRQISIQLDPELFLVLFIAPLLFDEAKNVDKAARWRTADRCSRSRSCSPSSRRSSSASP